MSVEKIPLKDFKPQDEPKHIRDAAAPFAKDRIPEQERKALKEREKQERK